MAKPRANTATAHKLARMVYFMLTRGEACVDQGQQHCEEQQRQRSIAALGRRATAFSFAVMPTPLPARSVPQPFLFLIRVPIIEDDAYGMLPRESLPPLATRWVRDGMAEAMLHAIRAERAARMAMAAQQLAHHDLRSQPEGFHCWLQLGGESAGAWRGVEFASYLRTQGVAVLASPAFSADGDRPAAERAGPPAPTPRDGGVAAIG
jgi:hypothetical protein